MARVYRGSISSKLVYFRQSLSGQIDRQDRVGELARLLYADNKCPRGKACGVYQLFDYLVSQDAGRAALKACIKGWTEYLRQIHHHIDNHPQAGSNLLACLRDDI